MSAAGATSTALRRPWVHLARAAWGVLAVLCLLLSLYGIVAALGNPLPSCVADAAACPTTTQITREDAALAVALGFPLFEFGLVISVVTRWSLAVVGLIIFWRRSDDWVAMLVSAALMTVLLEGLQISNPALNAAASVLLAVGTALFLPIPFLFPNGRFEPRWIRWPALTITAAYAVVTAFFVNARDFAGPSLVLNSAWVGLAIYSMPYRYFRVANPTEQQQIKWVLLGLAASFVTAVCYTSVAAFFPLWQPSPARVAAIIITMLVYPAGYGFLAFAMLVAMLRYRLWDIGLVLRRTLVYSALTALLALTYFGLVIVLQGVVGALPAPAAAGAAQRSGARPEWVIVASTLAVAALFAPLRGRLQSFIDQRFFRRKYDAAKTLAGFAAVTRDETDLNALTGKLADVVHETMAPENVGVWLRSSSPGLPPNGPGQADPRTRRT